LDNRVFDEKRFWSLIPNQTPQDANLAQNIPQIQKPPREMVSIFLPLTLPTQLHDFPQKYSQRIKLYDAKENTPSQKHLNWFNDFIDLEEVDHEDTKMMLFV
jgi:hypothetical protein